MSSQSGEPFDFVSQHFTGNSKNTTITVLMVTFEIMNNSK